MFSLGKPMQTFINRFKHLWVRLDTKEATALDYFVGLFLVTIFLSFCIMLIIALLYYFGYWTLIPPTLFSIYYVYQHGDKNVKRK